MTRRRLTSFLEVLLLLFLFGPRGAAAKQVAFALAIGNNAPPPEESAEPLRYADDDAVRFYQLFSRFAAQARLLAVLDLDTQRRHPDLAAISQAPTQGNLLRVVAELLASMTAERARGNEPILYLSYSGHGTIGRGGAAGLALLDGLLTQELLYDRVLGPLPLAYGHLFIDACHAGAVVGLRGAENDQRPKESREIDAVRAPLLEGDLHMLLEGRRNRFPMIGILAASTAGQEAHEWSRVQSGVFTHEVLSGLLGAADVNGDLQIEYSELQAFVAAANRALPDPRAAPQLLVQAPPLHQRLPLLSLRTLRDTAYLSGPAAHLGRFHIELENGERYLDAHFAKDAIPTLAIPANTPLFLRTADQEAALYLPAAATQRLDSLALRRRDSSDRGSLELAYERALFHEPYGPTYYRGFADSQGLLGVSFVGGSASATLGLENAAASAQRRLPAYRRPLALSLLVLTCASSVAALAAGAIAAKARADFDASIYQRDAFAQRDRYMIGSAVFWPSMTLALIGAVGTVLAWPKSAAARKEVRR